MQVRTDTPRPLAAERSPWLRGRLDVPGDAVLTHLALACGALARGWSEIESPLAVPGSIAFCDALEMFGARVVREDRRWHVCGPGTGGLLEPPGEIVFAGAPLGLELLAGLAGTAGFPTHIEGINPELSARRLDGLIAGLSRFGAAATTNRGRLPLSLRGPALALPATIELPPGLPSTKAALLLAALGVPGTSTLLEKPATADHAERMLTRFGAGLRLAPLDPDGRRIEVPGLTELAAQHLAIPADTSLAALGALAATIVSGSELTVEAVLLNPARIAVLAALVAMGARVELQARRESGGEPVADLAVRHARLKGIGFAPAHVAPLLADLPLLAVAAAFAEGDTVFNLPPDLPLEIRARIADIVRALSANGVVCGADDEQFAVRGAERVRGGGRVMTAGDPDLGLAFLVMGMAADDQVTISDQSGIHGRFPGFVEAFEDVGASFVRYSD